MSRPYTVVVGPAPDYAVDLGHDAYVSREALARAGWAVVSDRPGWWPAEQARAEFAALPTVERWWAALWQHRAQEVE